MSTFGFVNHAMEGIYTDGGTSMSLIVLGIWERKRQFSKTVPVGIVDEPNVRKQQIGISLMKRVFSDSFDGSIRIGLNLENLLCEKPKVY